MILLLLPLRSNQQTAEPSVHTSGKASYYHDTLHGLETSNGETYDKDDFTAAHRTLPFNTILLVINRKNNRSAIVRVNDRGPFVKSRAIDLSRSAAKKLRMIPFGVVPVKIMELKFLNEHPISDEFMMENDIWDCYGKKKMLHGTTVFIWSTQDWKHAFYMASSLSMDYKTHDLAIRIKGREKDRIYQLLITGLNNKKAKELISQLRRDGFTHAGVYSIPPEAASQHESR